MSDFSNDKAIKDILDIFNLGGNKDTEEKTSDYSNTAADDQREKSSFESLLSDIGDKIAEGKESPTLPFTPKETPQPVKETTVQPQPEVKKVEVPQPSKVEEKPQPEVKTETKQEVQINTVSSEVSSEIESAINTIITSTKSNNDALDLDNLFDTPISNPGSLKEETKLDVGNVKESNESEEEDEFLVGRDITGSVSKEDSLPEKTETAPESSSEQPTPFDLPQKTVDQGLQKEVTGAKVKNNVKIVKGQIQWLLDSPGEKFISFYEQKSEAISLICRGPEGQIPFDEFNQELRKATVDVTVHGFDPNGVLDRMKTVQQLRDRITQIAAEVNEQYFLCDRYIELLHGCLARVEYEKPAARQGGVIFQHMRDLEFYYSQLKHLHNHTTLVLKNLEAAWETLSRQVTLFSFNMKEPESQARRLNNSYQNREYKEQDSNNDTINVTIPAPDSDSMWNEMMRNDASVKKTESVLTSPGDSQNKVAQFADW